MKKLTAIFLSLIMVAAICVSSAMLAFAEADSAATSSEAASEEPTAHEPADINVSHVNRYSYGTYNAMVITGEGKNSESVVGYKCEWWRAIKVDNVGGKYVVAAIEESSSAAKTLTASKDGFILYVFSGDGGKDYPQAQKVQVGDIATLNVDISKEASSETPIGTITFTSPEGNTSEGASSEATSSEATSSVATSSEATPSVAASSADTSSTAPTAPSTGDAGMIVLVVLALVAVAGVAVMVKARR